MVLDKDIPGKKRHNNGVRQGYTWKETSLMVLDKDIPGMKHHNNGVRQGYTWKETSQ